MNRIAIAALVTALVGATIGVYAKQHPPTHDVNPICGLYNQCAGHDGMEAVFVKDMQIGDTVSLDVTIVSATTDAGWKWMCDSLHLVPAVFKDIGKDIEISHLSPPCHPEKTIKYTEGEPCDLVVVSVENRKVYVFHNYRTDIRQQINNHKNKEK